MTELNKLKQKYEDGGKAEKIKGLTKSLQAEASIGPIPRSKAAEFMGDKVAGAFRSARNAMSAEIPLIGGTVGELLIGQTPEALEDWSYGFGPFRAGRTDVVGPAGALYGMKVDDRILDVAGAVELPYLAGKLGAKGTAKAAQRFMDAMKGSKSAELETMQRKYQGGGRVGRFVSAVDKAIDVLKQKKGTGEQILKQIEATPGVKQEELETRGIKQKLQASPKITQEELKQTARRNKPPIPQRQVLGAGVPEDYKPKLKSRSQEVLDEYGIEPVVNPEDRRMMAFMVHETGDIVDGATIKSLYPDEMGFPVGPDGKIAPEAAKDYKDLMNAISEADKYFQNDLMKYEAKFQRYSQPGGENYREVLVHLPEGASASVSAKRNRLAELMEGRDPSRAFNELTPEARFEAMSLMDDITSVDNFRSSHYDVPNILTHFRVSDRVGPNGEKVLYVDEIQSDWHQKARDARKNYIRGVLADEKDIIHRKAVDEIVSKGFGTDITDANLKELDRIKNRLTNERKAELDKTTPKDFGYRTQQDIDEMRRLSDEQRRISNEGLSPEEVANYFKPGRIIKDSGGYYDKVISFNSGEGTASYQRIYEQALERALSVGNIDREVAEQWARKKAADESKYNWSVTVIQVDPRTGQPKRGAEPRTHQTSPADEIKRDLANQHERLSQKVPDAPFKDTWHELAVKEIMDMAANEGYAKVAFSPGIEQVKRYSNELRQAVDEIKFAPGDNGAVTITAGKEGRNAFRGTAIDGMFIDGPAKGKSVSEVFGSGIAKQIDEQKDASQMLPGTKARMMPQMSADELLAAHGDEMTEEQRSWLNRFIKDWEDNVDSSAAGRGFEAEMTDSYDKWLRTQTLGHTTPPIRGGIIKGEDLTVGGEGMKSFYDKRLPDFIRKYAGKEFDAKTDYLDIEMQPATKKKPSESEIKRLMDEIANEESDDLMYRTRELNDRMAREALQTQGIGPNSPDFDNRFWEVADEFQDRAWEQAVRELAIERLNVAEPGAKMRAFTVDVTPKMREKITTEGQKLFAVPPVIGAVPAAQQLVPPAEPQEEPQKPPQVSPEAPEGFQSGGRVGLVKKAAEKLSGALRDTQEQKMLQGLYRGYAGDYDTAKASEASGLIYATPQRRAAENYANRRSQQMQADPHIEMLLVDPFEGRKYGHSVMTKASEEPIITQARELKPEQVKSVTQLKKRGGLAQAFSKSL